MKRYRWLLVMGAAMALVLSSGGKTRQKRLIEFGADEPDPAFLRQHAALMAKTAFDGCVFHLNYTQPDGKTGTFTWEAWGKKAFTKEQLQPALNEMKAAKLGRFKQNFLRFNTTPADLDWFDDYSTVLENAYLAAWFAREAKLPGMLFDLEQYNYKLFNYRKQRDAATKSFNEYAAQVRKRGREVMEAFERGDPGLTVFLTIGHSYTWDQMHPRNRKIEDVSYGLLAPFCDGLLDGAKGRTRIVDGDEAAYSYRREADFERGYRMMKEGTLPIVADPAKYAKRMSFSFGIWMDAESHKIVWNTEDFTKNTYTPETLEALLRKALQTADEYVWLYSEQPRWWSPPDGKPVNLPQAYEAAVRRARGMPD